MKRLMISALLLISSVQLSLFAEDVAQTAKLPKVLIIGDSISMGYTPYAKKALAGKAFVTRHKGNGGPSIRGIVHIDKWLGDTKWDIIHFNWGLWDMYGWEYVKEDRSPAMYKKRLEKLVLRLKKTGATLIWGTTTPACPAAEKTMLKRFNNTTVIIKPELEKQYLDAALEVMKQHQIKINDLHALMAPKLKEYSRGKDDVHYTKEGSELLGKQVAESIEKAINRE